MPQDNTYPTESYDPLSTFGSDVKQSSERRRPEEEEAQRASLGGSRARLASLNPRISHEKPASLYRRSSARLSFLNLKDETEKELQAESKSLAKEKNVSSTRGLSNYTVQIGPRHLEDGWVGKVLSTDRRSGEENSNSILETIIGGFGQKFGLGLGSRKGQASTFRTVAGQNIHVNFRETEDINQGTPTNFEQETIGLSKTEEGTGSLHHPWIAAVWYWLMAVLDPPPEGAYRATYTCECGELSYMDLEELVPGRAAELEKEIRKEAHLIRCHVPNSSISPSNNIQTPAPAHLATSNLSHHGGQGAPIQGLPTRSEGSQSSDIANASVQASAAGNANTALKYLLLCVNTKHGLVKLEHIDVSTLTNDRYLFDEIRDVYKAARRGHDWDLTTLIPGRGKIPKWTIALISMIFPHNIKFPNWTIGPLQDCRLFVPRKMEFVKFELMPVLEEICAGAIEKPEVPGAEEVEVKKTYQCNLTEAQVKVLSIPIHMLLVKGPHYDMFWWKKFPKKLDSPLTYITNSYCPGWGILVEEGWNRRLVLFLCFLATVVFTIFVILYSVFTNDGSTGAGIGSFMMAILTLYCTLRYEQWKEQ